MSTFPCEYEPVKICVTEALLGQVRGALESGLEAAEDCYFDALERYGDRKPNRIQYQAGEVAKIREALRSLQKQAPSVFPRKQTEVQS